MLSLARSKVGKGNWGPNVKTLSCHYDTFDAQFSPHFGALRVEWRNSTPHFALSSERKNENI